MTALTGKVGFASPNSEKSLSRKRTAGVELIATLAFAFSLIVAATAVSFGVARAQSAVPIRTTAHGMRRAFRRRSARRGCEGPLLFGPDAGVLDHRPPLVEFSLMICKKRRRALLIAREDHHAEAFDPLLHRGVGQRRRHARNQPVDDGFRRAFCGPQAMPERRCSVPARRTRSSSACSAISASGLRS